jgi:hypothetical protein
MATATTKSDSKVAARALLDEGNVNARDQLERQAKDQEQRQADLLKNGVVSGDEKKLADKRAEIGEDNRAALRQPAGVHENQGPIGGFVDQTTARSDEDAKVGHMVKIDLNAKGVPEHLKESGRDYGAFVDVAETDPSNGYPLVAEVRMRDAGNSLERVPYVALRETDQRGR